MKIDHLSIFSNNKGKEIDELLNFGFIEGSSRIHSGQGTINRKIYFDNFFLEILWVTDKKEIQSDATSLTKLWERSQHMTNQYSPFGLYLVNTESTDKLFEDSEIYQPSYFPKGISIDMITNEQKPSLPCTFRLPYRGKQKAHDEPINHLNKINSLTKVKFEITREQSECEFINHFKPLVNIVFIPSERLHLTLEFDNLIKGKEKEFSALSLTIKY